MTSTLANTTNKERALSLLGAGVGTEETAATLGVTPAAISQLLSDASFSDKVAQLRYEGLQVHTKRDGKYDSIEDTLLNKLERSVALMIKPRDILEAVKVVNNAKRRGQVAASTAGANSNLVSIVMPTQIVQNFTTNNNNQVTRAGDQSLLTIPSELLLKQTKKKLDTLSLPNNQENNSDQTIEASEGEFVRC